MQKQHHPLIKGKATQIDYLVSQRLKMRRLLLGFTQQELSTALKVSIQQIQKYENGINRISCGKLYNIADFLRVPVTYFFESNYNFTHNLHYIVAEEQEEYLPNFLDDILVPNFLDYDVNLQKVNQFINHYGHDILSHAEGSNKDLIKLVKAFNDIKNKQVRKKIIELLESINN